MSNYCASCLKTCFVNPFNLPVIVASRAYVKTALVATMIPVISFLVFMSAAKKEESFSHKVSFAIRAIVSLLTFGVLTLLLDLIVYLSKKIQQYVCRERRGLPENM